MMSLDPAAERFDLPSVLTVDVEEYFQVTAFAGTIRPEQWDSLPFRVRASTMRLLDLCDEHGAKGTFFVVGWVARRHPELISEIARRGHELACHSDLHRLVYKLTPSEFRADTRAAKDSIEQAGGVGVTGYRAPSFSITQKSLWALPILAELGFQYDCSVFPIRHDFYGIPDGPRRPYRVETEAGPIIEIPMTTFRLGRHVLPVGGGGYLRILPWWYTMYGLGQARREEIGWVVYVHPWEIDVDQPRMSCSFRSRLRHYTNLHKTYARLSRLIADDRFCSIHGSSLLETRSRTLKT